MTEEETGIRIISKGKISRSLMFTLQREAVVEKAIADAEGREPFSDAICVDSGTLERQNDGTVLFIHGDW